MQLDSYMGQVGWDGRQERPRQVDPRDWRETLEPFSDAFKAEPFLGPWA